MTSTGAERQFSCHHVETDRYAREGPHVNRLDRWRETKMTPEQRGTVLDLADAIKAALSDGRATDASAHALRMHSLSQDHAGLHAYGHWLSARVHFAGGRRGSTLRDVYLAMMAPWGTLRRRLRAPD